MVTLHNTRSPLEVKIEGQFFLIVELIEQLSWLGCVCRANATSHRLRMVTPNILRISRERFEPHWPTYSICFTAREMPDDPDSGHCWQKLFNGGSIADGMPISPRQDEEGIEIPFAMMAKLGGFDRVAHRSGQLMLKGFEALQVPVRKNDASIVWHLIAEPNSRRISYNAVDQLKVELDQSINMEDLYRSKHYLGWASHTSQHAGQYSMYMCLAADSDRW